jgi:hypothetical protein
MRRACSKAVAAGLTATMVTGGLAPAAGATPSGPHQVRSAVAPAGLPVSTITPFGDAAAQQPFGGIGAAIATSPYGGVDVAAPDGQVQGDAYGQPITSLNAPVVAVAPAPFGAWMASTDGGVFTTGGVGFFGSLGGIRLAKPIVGMAATRDGRGYWLVASDGGVFSFGDAGFFGSLGGIRLAKPIVGMAVTPDGGGYWLVASDGGVFSFGDAGFFGSLGGIRLAQPVVGMAASLAGGYWLVAADGGVFSFGGAPFDGSLVKSANAGSTVGIAGTNDGRGYWILSSAPGLVADADALTFGGFTPLYAASTRLPSAQDFSEIVAIDDRTTFLSVFFYVGGAKVASTGPEPGLETVPPGVETSSYPQSGVTAGGQLLLGYPTTTYTYTYAWTGSRVSAAAVNF